MRGGKEPVLLDWAEDGRFGEDVKGRAAAHAECARRIGTPAHTMRALHEDRMRMRSQRKRANAGEGVDEGDPALSDESTRRGRARARCAGLSDLSLIATDALGPQCRKHAKARLAWEGKGVHDTQPADPNLHENETQLTRSLYDLMHKLECCYTMPLLTSQELRRGDHGARALGLSDFAGSVRAPRTEISQAGRERAAVRPWWRKEANFEIRSGRRGRIHSEDAHSPKMPGQVRKGEREAEREKERRCQGSCSCLAVNARNKRLPRLPLWPPPPPIPDATHDALIAFRSLPPPPPPATECTSLDSPSLVIATHLPTVSALRLFTTRASRSLLATLIMAQPIRLKKPAACRCGPPQFGRIL
ncbi:hypothetical protein L1887_49207 [Cichorium endivia]|nr:hypothetical protein L1887_49207 [Cichorium endivia]